MSKCQASFTLCKETITWNPHIPQVPNNGVFLPQQCVKSEASKFDLILGPLVVFGLWVFVSHHFSALLLMCHCFFCYALPCREIIETQRVEVHCTRQSPPMRGKSCGPVGEVHCMRQIPPMRGRSCGHLAGNVADMSRHVGDDTTCRSNFGQMSLCCRHKI